MTKLNRGLGAVWHVYEKNTGKGIYDIIRVAHSHQSSLKLQAWHDSIKNGLDKKAIPKLAKERCMAEAYANEDNKRKMLTNGGTSCKMAYLRLYLRQVLCEKARRENRATAKCQSSSESTPYVPPGYTPGYPPGMNVTRY